MPQFPSLYNADYNSNYISGVSFCYYWKAFIRMPGTSRCSIYIHYYQLKYYYDYSKFQWLPFIFIFWASQTTWKRPHYLTADANHRCSENDYKVLRSLSSSSLSQKLSVLLGPQTQLFTTLNDHFTIGCKGPLFCIFWKQIYYKQINVPDLLFSPPMLVSVYVFNKLFIVVLCNY